MTKFTSKIAGVEIRIDSADHGRHALYQVAGCSSCDVTLQIPCNHMPLPENAVSKKLGRAGWRFDRSGRHKCPACLLAGRKPASPETTQPEPVATEAPKRTGPGGKREVRPVEIAGTTYATVNAAAKALGVSNSTICRHADAGTLDELTAFVAARKTQKETVTVTTTAVEPPREPTRVQKREIMDLLASAYDTKNERYLSGDTDETIAQELDVMPGWVAQLREEFFGPNGGNEDIDRLAGEVADFLKEARAALAMAEESVKTLTAGVGRAEEFAEKLDRIKAAVGPRKLKVAGI